jgi:hypothetical protein
LRPRIARPAQQAQQRGGQQGGEKPAYRAELDEDDEREW